MSVIPTLLICGVPASEWVLDRNIRMYVHPNGRKMDQEMFEGFVNNGHSPFISDAQITPHRVGELRWFGGKPTGYRAINCVNCGAPPEHGRCSYCGSIR